MSNNDVPIWEKYTLTIEEASKYFRIGENKLRRLAEENPTAGWVILNGNRTQSTFSCALPYPPHRAERQMGAKATPGV